MENLFKAIQLSPEFIGDITLAALTLHNILRSSVKSRLTYCPRGLADEIDVDTGELREGKWRMDADGTNMVPLTVPASGHNASTDAKEVRKMFRKMKNYFENEGSVPWQWERVINVSLQ